MHERAIYMVNSFQFTRSARLSLVYQNPQNGAGDASVTIAFRDFRVLDSGSQPISGFLYTSESGTDYGIAGGTPTPEPAGFTFVGASLLLCLASRRRGALQIH
jgi:hypothetical protein